MQYAPVPFFLHAGQHNSAFIVIHTCIFEFGIFISCNRVKKLNSLYAGDDIPINLAFFIDIIGKTTLINPATSQKAISSQITNTYSSLP